MLNRPPFHRIGLDVVLCRTPEYSSFSAELPACEVSPAHEYQLIEDKSIVRYNCVSVNRAFSRFEHIPTTRDEMNRTTQRR
jgi:hypothetical protein